MLRMRHDVVAGRSERHARREFPVRTVPTRFRQSLTSPCSLRSTCGPSIFGLAQDLLSTTSTTRPLMTSACAGPCRWRWIWRRSMRPSSAVWEIRLRTDCMPTPRRGLARPSTSGPKRSSHTTGMTRKGRSNCWPMRAIPMASTPVWTTTCAPIRVAPRLCLSAGHRAIEGYRRQAFPESVAHPGQVQVQKRLQFGVPVTPMLLAGRRHVAIRIPRTSRGWGSGGVDRDGAARAR